MGQLVQFRQALINSLQDIHDIYRQQCVVNGIDTKNGLRLMEKIYQDTVKEATKHVLSKNIVPKNNLVFIDKYLNGTYDDDNPDPIYG